MKEFINIFTDIFQINPFIDILKIHVIASLSSNINHFIPFYHFISISSSSITEYIPAKIELELILFFDQKYFSNIDKKKEMINIVEKEDQDYLFLINSVYFIDNILFGKSKSRLSI